jgi:cyclophilin family peptidyl-prolyl cis-trans isomerase
MANPTVTFETSMGAITLELDAEKAPATVTNFVEYAKANHYNGTVFHRVIPGFMIQGGGYDVAMREKATRPPIRNEAANGLKNRRGTVAMARTGEPHSASAQFFVNLVDNDFLDHTAQTAQGWGYAVFGKVTAGLDVVDRIAAVPTAARGGHEAVPQRPIVVVKTVVS